jgi:hypothetical protein
MKTPRGTARAKKRLGAKPNPTPGSNPTREQVRHDRMVAALPGYTLGHAARRHP